MKFETEILRVDVPTLAGHIYSKEVIQQAIERCHEQVSSGRLLVYRGASSDPPNIADAMGVVRRLHLEGGRLLAEIETLDMPGSAMLDDRRVVISPVGWATSELSGESVVVGHDYEFAYLKARLNTGRE